MTLQSISGQEQIAQRCQFWVMLGSRFLDNGSIGFKTVYRIGKGDSRTSSFIVWRCDIFASWPRKWGSSGPTVVYALQNGWFRFCRNYDPQVHTSVTLEGIYICTINDVISYLRLAANRVHATAAVTDFTVTKWSFWKISESTESSIFKIYRHIALCSPSLYFDRKWHHNLLPVGSKSLKRVNFRSYSGRDFSITVQPISNIGLLVCK